MISTVPVAVLHPAKAPSYSFAFIDLECLKVRGKLQFHTRHTRHDIVIINRPSRVET
jgi:hypothetical protein